MKKEERNDDWAKTAGCYKKDIVSRCPHASKDPLNVVMAAANFSSEVRELEEFKRRKTNLLFHPPDFFLHALLMHSTPA